MASPEQTPLDRAKAAMLDLFEDDDRRVGGQYGGEYMQSIFGTGRDAVRDEVLGCLQAGTPDAANVLRAAETVARGLLETRVHERNVVEDPDSLERIAAAVDALRGALRETGLEGVDVLANGDLATKHEKITQSAARIREYQNMF